jgi:hypothetical protein
LDIHVAEHRRYRCDFPERTNPRYVVRDHLQGKHSELAFVNRSFDEVVYWRARILVSTIERRSAPEVACRRAILGDHPKSAADGHLKTGQRQAAVQDASSDSRAATLGDVSNVLNEEKKQQVIALGRLGWSRWRIQKNTGVRRETAAAYLKAARIAFRPPGGWGRQSPAKMANEASLAVNPPAFQGFVVRLRQADCNGVGVQALVNLPTMFAAYKCAQSQRIFVFSLRVLVVYTAVEDFSPLWVDGSRSSAGHCHIWRAIQNRARSSDSRASRRWGLRSDVGATRKALNGRGFGGNGTRIRDYDKPAAGSSRCARAALHLHSIKRRSRCTAVFPGVSVLSKPTPALSKCLKL